MTRRSSKKKVVWVLVGIIAVVGAYFTYRSLAGTDQNEQKYQQIKVEKGEIRVTILSTGIVQPQNRLEIKPPIPGRVETVLADEGDSVRKGQVLAWMSSSERAALLDAARAKGPAAVKEWEDLFRPTPIIAPISGAIIKRNVESGQTFGTGEAVFVMSDVLTVKAQVDETDLGQVYLKQQADITLDAYPDIAISGLVNKIAFEGTTVNNVTVYIVDVIPAQPPNVMKSGMTANVVFDVEKKSNILIVPSNAVKFRDGKHFVLLPIQDQDKEKEKKPKEREVTTGISDGRRVEIKAGLEENEAILVPEFEMPEGDTANNPFSPFGGRRPPTRRPGG